jgi:hypothetical protein
MLSQIREGERELWTIHQSIHASLLGNNKPNGKYLNNRGRPNSLNTQASLRHPGRANPDNIQINLKANNTNTQASPRHPGKANPDNTQAR